MNFYDLIKTFKFQSTYANLQISYGHYTKCFYYSMPNYFQRSESGGIRFKLPVFAKQLILKPNIFINAIRHFVVDGNS